MKAGMDKGKGKGYRCKTRQGDRDKKWDKENRKDSHGTVGLQVVTQSGITHRNEGE